VYYIDVILLFVFYHLFIYTVLLVSSWLNNTIALAVRFTVLQQFQPLGALIYLCLRGTHGHVISVGRYGQIEGSG
jgi:hypothetical protein